MPVNTPDMSSWISDKKHLTISNTSNSIIQTKYRVPIHVNSYRPGYLTNFKGSKEPTPIIPKFLTFSISDSNLVVTLPSGTFITDFNAYLVNVTNNIDVTNIIQNVIIGGEFRIPNIAATLLPTKSYRIRLECARINDPNCSPTIYSNTITIPTVTVVGGGSGNNTLFYSTNGGTNWVGNRNAIFTTECLSIAWNGTIWVAVGNGTNTIAYSYNGIYWTGLGTSVLSGSGNSVDWINGSFIVGGSGTKGSVALSTDGMTWTNASMTLTNVKSIASNGSRIIVVGDNVGGIIAAYSDDNGSSWTDIIDPLSATTPITSVNDIKYNGASFVIAVSVSGVNPVSKLYSLDGINWIVNTNVAFSTGISIENFDVSTMFAIGSGGGSGNSLERSTDYGLTWTQVTDPIATSASDIASKGSMFLTVNNTLFICAKTFLAYTTNGISWSTVNINIPASQLKHAVFKGQKQTTFELATIAGSFDPTTPYDGSPGRIETLTVFDYVNDPNGDYLYLSDRNVQKIRKCILNTGTLSTVAGTGSNLIADGNALTQAAFAYPEGVAYDKINNTLYVAHDVFLRKISFNNDPDTVSTVSNPLNITFSFIFYRLGYLYISNKNTYKIYKLNISTNEITLIAGTVSGDVNGSGATAAFSTLGSICVDKYGKFLYVHDIGNNKIKQIDLSSNYVTSIATVPDVNTLSYNSIDNCLYFTQSTFIKKINLNLQPSYPISIVYQSALLNTYFILLNIPHEIYLTSSKTIEKLSKKITMTSA